MSGLRSEVNEPHATVGTSNGNRISEDDLFGLYLFQAEGPPDRDAYYRAIEELRPLVSSADWRLAVTGWYLNISKSATARLSYFTTDPEAVEASVTPHLRDHRGVALFEPAHPPTPIKIAAQYGGDEPRFRRFLSTYSLIGLDLMEADLVHAQRLCITLRCQVFLEGSSYREHLEPTCVRDSPSYRALKPTDRDQFWLDMENRPVPDNVDWAHMFVNLVMAGDLNWLFREPLHPPFTRMQINQLMASYGFGFDVPDDWSPEKRVV